MKTYITHLQKYIKNLNSDLILWRNWEWSVARLFDYCFLQDILSLTMAPIYKSNILGNSAVVNSHTHNLSIFVFSRKQYSEKDCFLIICNSRLFFAKTINFWTSDLTFHDKTMYCCKDNTKLYSLNITVNDKMTTDC